MIACMIVRNELHDANSFSELSPQYSLFKYVLYCLEFVSYPSFFRHHKAIMSSLTRMIDFTPAAFFLSQFLHLKINVRSHVRFNVFGSVICVVLNKRWLVN